MTRLRRIGTAIAVAALTVGASLVASASPADAAPASSGTFTTPKWGLVCYTETTGYFGNYHGAAMCNAVRGVGTWKVRVNCTAGFSYETDYVSATPWTWVYYLSPSSSCFFGVDSVQVIEGP